MKLWGSSEPSPQESEEIKKYIARKEFLIKNKYTILLSIAKIKTRWRLDIEQPFKRDITKEVDAFLQEKFNNFADKFNN